MKEFQLAEWALLAKCITNEASYEEQFSMQRLLKENENRKIVFDQLSKFYDDKGKPTEKNSVAAFKKLDSRIKGHKQFMA
jgi:hypothetical protein